MSDEAESSRAGRRHGTADAARADPDDVLAVVDDNNDDDLEDAAQRAQRAKERRVDAKRKRVIFLDHLLRELDTLVFLELITLYHLEYAGDPAASHALITSLAAPSSGSSSAPSSMARSSRPSRTWASTASTMNTSRTCP